MKETEFPPLYVAADAASLAAQQHFLRALGGNLFLLVVAAAMSVINYPHVVFAAGQIVVLSASLCLTVFLAVKEPQKIWYGTRALAESVKTITWRYVTRAEPFNGSDAEARGVFGDSLKKILESNKHVSLHAVKFEPGQSISAAMSAMRSKTLRERKEDYQKLRINDQLTWYQKKAAWNKRRAQIWFGVVVVMNACALGFAIARIQFPKTENWPTDIFVAAAASILGWVQTKRFQELSGSYTLTAHEIMLMVVPTDNRDDSFSSFVGDAENAFSREHTQWQARRDVK